MDLRIHRPSFGLQQAIDRQPAGNTASLRDAVFPPFLKENAMLNPSTERPRQAVCILLGGPRQVVPRAVPQVAALLRSIPRQPV